MRKLFIILIVFLAVVTFIRAFDNSGNVNLEVSSEISGDSRILVDWSVPLPMTPCNRPPGTEKYSFFDILDDACVRLEDKQVAFVVNRLVELGTVLDRLEAELDSLILESARQMPEQAASSAAV